MRFGTVSDPPSKIIARERIDTCDLFGGQYEFLRFKVQTADGTEVRDLTLKTELAFAVLLEDIQPFEGMDAGTQLGAYIEVVEYIISRFEDEFA